MTSNKKALFEQYAHTCAEEKIVTARKKKLKEDIEALMPQEPHTEKSDYGTFKMVEYPKWTYSDETSKLAEDLKIRKIDEEEQGVATKEVTYSLRFNAKK